MANIAFDGGLTSPETKRLKPNYGPGSYPTPEGELPPIGEEPITGPGEIKPVAPVSSYSLPNWEGAETTLKSTSDLTTEELLKNDQLAKAAYNIAVSRGINPSASWLWNISGADEDAENAVVNYITSDTGWKFYPGPDNIQDTPDDIYEDPEGIKYTYDEYSLMVDESNAKYSKAQEILQMPEGERLDALKEYFPELAIMSRVPDDTGRMLTNYGPQFIQPEDVADILYNYLDERRAYVEDLTALAGKAVPDEADVDRVVSQIIADPQGFIDTLHNTPRTETMDALLKAAVPNLTEDEIRNAYGQAPLLSIEEWQKSAYENTFGGIGLFNDQGLVVRYPKADELGEQWAKDMYQDYVDSVSDMGGWGRGWTAAAGNLMTYIAGGMKWLGIDGISDQMLKHGKQEVNTGVVATRKYNPWSPESWTSAEFLQSQVLPQAGTTAFFLAISLVSGGSAAGVVGKLGLGKYATAALTGLAGAQFPTMIEASLEAGQVYDQAIESGMSVKDAKAAANKTFGLNMVMLEATGIITMGISFAPIKNPLSTMDNLIAKGLVRTTIIGGKVVVDGLSEGGEEVYQQLVQMQALGDRRSIAEKLKDDDMKMVFALGAIQGGLFAGGSEVYEAFSNRVVSSLPAPLQLQYMTYLNDNILAGMTDSQAKTSALDTIAETAEGAKVIEAAIKTEQIEAYQKAVKPKTEAEKVSWDATFDKQKESIAAKYPDVEVAIPEMPERTVWQQAVSEATYRISQLEDYTREGDVIVDAAIKEVAVKYGVPEGTLHRSILWEAISSGEARIGLTKADVDKLVAEYTTHTTKAEAGKGEVTITEASKIPALTTDIGGNKSSFLPVKVLEHNGIKLAQIDHILGMGKVSDIYAWIGGEWKRLVGNTKLYKNNVVPLVEKAQTKFSAELAPESISGTSETDAFKGMGPGTPSVEFFTPQTGKSLTDLKLALVDYIKKNLPPKLQGKMLTDVAKIDRGVEFEKAVSKVNRLAEAYHNAEYKAFLEKNGLDIENIKPKDPLPVEPVKKLIALIENALPARYLTEGLKHDARAKQASIMRNIFESTVGYDAYIKSLSSLKGELPTVDYILDRESVGMTADDERALWKVVSDAHLREFETLNTFKALEKLLSGQMPTTGELARLEKVFGRELAEAIIKKMSPGKRVFEEIIGALNLPRTLLTIVDDSFLLRQAGMVVYGYPQEAFDALKTSFQVMFSEKKATQVRKSIEANLNYELLENADLYQSSRYRGMATERINVKEEAFMTRLHEKIPILKQIVEMAERSYTLGLDKIRSDVFYKFVRENESRNPPMAEYKAAANAINVLTGRGNLGSLEGRNLTQILSAGFFAPRYMISRVQAPLQLLNKYPAVRKMAARGLVSWFAANSVWLGLILLAGGTVEDDPRSSDFGKGRLGNTRLDFWAGEVQWARAIAQLLTGQRKQLDSGAITEANRKDTVDAFLRSKASPLTGLVWDLLSGETAIGEEISVANVPTMLKERLVPLFIQDLWDAIQDQGLVGGVEALPAFFGVGVQTFGGDTFTNMSGKLGQTITFPGTGKVEIYGTDNMYSDTLGYIRSVETADVLSNNYFTPEVQSIAQARDIKVLIDQMPNVSLYKLAEKNANGDSIDQFYAQWQRWLTIRDDPKAQADFKEQYGKSFQELYSDYEKGNITRTQYTLIKEYAASSDKAAFLKAHPELNSNPRESYLTTHPQENALLALWGQADILTQAAYNSLIKLKDTLDIPDSALSRKIPPETLSKSYFQWNDAVNEYGTSSAEAKLIRLSDTKLEKWGEENLNWSPVKDNPKSLEIQVKYRVNYDAYDALETSDAKEKYLEANPLFRDYKNKAYALDLKDKNGNFMPESLAIKYAAYRKAKSPTTYRKANRDLDNWMVVAGEWQKLS